MKQFKIPDDGIFSLFAWSGIVIFLCLSFLTLYGYATTKEDSAKNPPGQAHYPECN